MLKRIKHIIRGRAQKKDTLIPVYHSIDNPSSNPIVLDNIHVITPENFRTQMLQLKEEYEIVFVDEIVSRLANNQSIKNLSAVTFDDGYQSVIDNAYPILQELNIPATLFVTPQMVEGQTFWRDKVRYVVNNEQEKDVLTFWAKQKGSSPNIEHSNFYKETKTPSIVSSKEVEELLGSYFEACDINLDELSSDLYIKSETLQEEREFLSLGNHSHSHYVLSSLSESDQEEEITSGEQFLLNSGVRMSKVFAIPFGGLTLFNEDTISILEKLSYSGFMMVSDAPLADALEMKQAHKNTCLQALTRFLPSNAASIYN